MSAATSAAWSGGSVTSSLTMVLSMSRLISRQRGDIASQAAWRSAGVSPSVHTAPVELPEPGQWSGYTPMN
jgi:hypothetical protein